MTKYFYNNKTTKITVENDNEKFVPSEEDHWLTDKLNEIYKDKFVLSDDIICGIVTFGKYENENK
jgi:hypothetical protein